MQCGAHVDPLRDPVCIIDGRVHNVCRACPGERNPTTLVEHTAIGLEQTAAGGSDRPSTRSTTAPLVEAEFLVAVDSRSVEGTSPSAGRRWRTYGVASVAALTLAIVATYIRSGSPSPAAVSGTTTHTQAAPRTHAGDNPSEDLPGEVRSTERGAADREPLDAIADVEFSDPDIGELTLETLPPTVEDVLEGGDEPLEAMLPILLDWVFPVQGSNEPFPLRASRRFGAKREGKRVAKCGRGHCGVDLKGNRKTPIVAVAWGEVVRIEWRTNKRSGRYVRIEHPESVFTSYMHLHAIAPGLRVGDEVQPGTVVGTLGRTGIKESAAHLHFSLEVPIDGRVKHIDPVPYLKRATRMLKPLKSVSDVESKTNE